MQRLRVTLITAATVIALTALTLSSFAQQPPGPNGGQGRGGRGGGPGFGGFRGWPGGFFGGGRSSDILRLAQNSAVQEGLKLKEPQKAKIKSLADDVNKRMQTIREQLGINFGRGQRGRGGQNPNNPNPNAQAGGQGGQFGGGQNPAIVGGGFGGQNPAIVGGGFGGQNPGNGGFGNPNGGRRGPRQIDPAMQQRFLTMREAQNELNQGAEQSLARILERGQYGRLKQIQLQADHPNALLRPDIIEKLNMDEEQVAQIRELMNERRQAQGEIRKARFDLTNAAFANLPTRNPGNNGPNGGNGGNGQAQGKGGPRGRFNDPAVKSAMQEFFDRPDTKAKMAEFQSRDDKINNLFMATLNRQIFTRRQSAAYKKMLGAPFDLSSLRGGPGRGFGPTASTATDAKAKGAGTAQPAPDDDEDETPAAKPAPTKSPSPSTARPKRKSLRELRGIPDKSG